MNDSKEQLETLLSDYVEGNLAGDELVAVEAYLDKNPGVRDVVNRLMIDSEALRSMPRVNAPFDFSEDVRGQLERDLLLQGTVTNIKPRRRLSSFVMTAAALLMIFGGVGGTAYWILMNRPASFVDLAANTPAPGEEGAAVEKTRVADAALGRDDIEKGDDRALDAVLSRAAEPMRKESPSGFSMATTPPLTAPAPGSPLTEAVPGPIPASVTALIEEAPRSHRRGVAIVLRLDEAAAVNETLHAFFATSGVRGQRLAYDAERGRAVSPQLADESVAQAPADSMQQTSGVITNAAAPSAIGQAMTSASYFRFEETQPQVVVASGLTQEQVEALQVELKKHLQGESPQTFALAEALAFASPQPGTIEPDGVGAEVVAGPAPTSRPALLASGDRLIVTLIDPDASNLRSQHSIEIDEAGMIELPRLDKLRAGGMTLAALRQAIVEQYVSNKLMANPVVDIRFADSHEAEIVPDERAQEVEQREEETRDLLDVFVVATPPVPATQPATMPASPTTQPQ